jgi:hypothetical protein
MIGLEAISAHNGWAMAVTGTLIVMSGLALLAFIISQLHKVIGIFEKKKGPAHATLQASGVNILSDLEATARMYKPLTKDLGDTFQLAQLYRLFEKEGLPHPHLTIRALRATKYLQRSGEGLFSWKKD